MIVKGELFLKLQVWLQAYLAIVGAVVNWVGAFDCVEWYFDRDIICILDTFKVERPIVNIAL